MRILTLSNSLSTLKVVKEILTIRVVSTVWFNSWIVVVWVLVDLIFGSFTMEFLGGLPGPDLGLESYLLFNSSIKNSEKAWYF